MTRIFVYGTLLRGGRWHHLLSTASFEGRVRTAARYRLVDLGPYPALRPSGGCAVPGELYTVDADLLAELDELEGHPGFYRRDRVDMEGAGEAQAWLLPEHLHTGAPTIESWPRP